MHSVKRIVAIAAIAALGLTASACAKAGSASGDEGPTVDQINTGRALYDEVTLAVYSTPEDRFRAEEVQSLKIQDAVATCMEKRGLRYSKSEFAKGLDPVSGPPNDLIAFAPITETYGIGESIAATSAAQAKSTASWDSSVTEQTGYPDAQTECTGSVPADVYDSHLPASFVEAEQALLNAIAPVTLDEGLKARMTDWSTCMATKGFTITPADDDPGAPWLALHNLVAEKYPADPADPSFADATANEKAVAAADGECRGPAHDYTMGLLTEPLAKFKTEQADLLARVSGEWAAMKSEAASLLGD